MFNPNLDGVTIVFTIIVFLESAIAIFLNAKSAIQGYSAYSKMRVAIATVSLILTCGYFYLLFCDVHPAVWATVFRGISIAVWPIVYWWPAVITLKEYKKVMSSRDELLNYMVKNDSEFVRATLEAKDPDYFEEG